MNTLTTLTTNNSKFVITPTGIQFKEELSYDEWMQMANDLGKAGRSIGFVIGDWINYGESRWREKYDEALKATRLSRQTLKDYAYVSRKVESSLRQDDLDFSIHAVVAKLKTNDEKQHWLSMAEKHDLSVRRLRKSINFGRLATEEEVQGDPADRGYVTYLALLNRIRRWWARETQKAPIDEWDDDRREGLKKDFKLILDIYEAL
ncbi:MAG: hypothetical protein ORN51_01855 [Akkermansiaceae bacterium]|nr:hypothetical protein [Akkermansiaceae bacterium]